MRREKITRVMRLTLTQITYTLEVHTYGNITNIYHKVCYTSQI
jgi:hypothetical protein